MPPSKEQKKWRDEFDKLFYQDKDRVWISRGGESYGSVTPQMGRGELFRFIKQTLREQLTEILSEMPEKSNPNYGKEWQDGLQEIHEATSGGWNGALDAIKALLTTRLSSLDSKV